MCVCRNSETRFLMSVDEEREKSWGDGGGEEFFTSLLASGPISLTRLVPSVTVTTSLAPSKLVRNEEPNSFL